MKQFSISERLFKEIAKAIGISANPDNFEMLNITNTQFIKEETKMPTKHIMTRAEATALVKDKVFGMVDTGQAARWVDFFIATGMLEIKEEKPKEAIVLFEQRASNGETVRLETWPEGLVLWVNGRIKYKYWEDTTK